MLEIIKNKIDRTSSFSVFLFNDNNDFFVHFDEIESEYIISKKNNVYLYDEKKYTPLFLQSTYFQFLHFKLDV